MVLWRKRAKFPSGPGEAIDTLVEKWVTDPDKVAWCRQERPDLSIDIMLVTVAEAVWFARDPVQQLLDPPPGGYGKAQNAIIREFATIDFGTWRTYARAYFDDQLLPGQTQEGQIRAFSMRGQWQASGGRPRWAKSRRSRLERGNSKPNEG